MGKNRGTEGHRLWLFDLAHGDLSREDMVKGFIKYYALEGFTLGNVQDDLIYRCFYPLDGAIKGLTSLREALEQAAEK